MNLFAALIRRYLASHPIVVERLAAHLLDALIEHVAPTTAAGLAGEASASPLKAVEVTTSTTDEVPF